MNPETKKQKTAANSGSNKPGGAAAQLSAGGQRFSTTRATLLQSASNYFSRLLEQDNDEFHLNMTGALRDEQGRVFVGRDPALFGQALDHLRNLDHFHVDSLAVQERDKLHKEALYYQLDGLVSMTRPPSTGHDESGLSAADDATRRDAMLARANLRLGTGSAKADELLIDLFATQHNVSGQQQLPLETLFDQPASSPQAYCLLDERVERARHERPPSPPASVEEFKERLIQFGGPLLKDFPAENVVIAGGAVLSCLQGQVGAGSGNKSDVDVFLVADTPEQARAVFDGIVEHLSMWNKRLDTTSISKNSQL